MDDSISRQAAIEAIKKNTFRLTVAEEQNAEGHVAWNAYVVYSDVAEGSLLELPSVQSETNCSEIPNNSDTISRQQAVDALDEIESEVADGYGYQYEKWRKYFCGLPSAQPEITTCIDCIHYIPLGKDKAWGRCSVHSSPTENQRMCQSCDFCAWAERRTDGSD